jgi:hypothetical protein
MLQPPPICVCHACRLHIGWENHQIYTTVLKATEAVNVTLLFKTPTL